MSFIDIDFASTDKQKEDNQNIQCRIKYCL
jgi:hypothetical protein